MYDFFPLYCADRGINPGKPGSARYNRLLDQYLRGDEVSVHFYEELNEIAVLLGGEVGYHGDQRFGGFVTCPAPGAHPADRSMVIKIDPSRPRDFYVYACSEALIDQADEHVRDLLRLPETEPEAEVAERIARAMEVWRAALPPAGTIVESYLRSRRPPLPPLPVIRFAPDLYHAGAQSHWPAMVALVTNVADEPTGVHLTYLARDGSGKAPLSKLDQRRTMGLMKGSAVRLATGDGRLLVGEGIETVWSLHAMKRSAWAVGGAKLLPSLELPASVHEVTILADGDDAGRISAAAAASKWGKEGRRVTVAEADEGKDFNDHLMEDDHE